MKEAPIYQLSADDISNLIQSVANDVLITREKAAELVDVDPDTIDRFADAGVLTRYYDSRPNTKRPIDQNQMTQKSDNQNNTLQGCDPIRTSRQVVLRFVALYFKRIHILQTSDIC